MWDSSQANQAEWPRGVLQLAELWGQTEGNEGKFICGKCSSRTLLLSLPGPNSCVHVP